MNIQNWKCCFFALSLLTASMFCCTGRQPGEITFYVSENGSDTDSGTESSPFKTLIRAKEAIRSIKTDGGLIRPVTVYLREGSYSLPEGFSLQPEDSGTKDCPVTYAAFPGETAVISGGKTVTGWKQEGMHWKAPALRDESGVIEFKQLYVNGKYRARPRLPKTGYYRVKDYSLKSSPAWNAKTDRFVYHDGNIDPDWKNLQDVQVVSPRFWTSSRQSIASVDRQKHVVQFNDSTRYRYSDDFSEDGARYYVENVYEALSEPGEWYLDKTEGFLYYIPVAGEDMNSATVIAPVMPRLLKIAGSPQENRFVEYVNFKNLTFSYNNWQLPAGKVGDGQSAPEVEGAVFLKGARNCRVQNCTFTNLSSYAVQIDSGCTNNRFIKNKLSHLGGGGFRIGGGGAHDHPLAQTGENVYSDNHIHHIGLFHHAATGIWIQHSYGNLIAHNHIHHTYYSSIAIGWVWGYSRSISSHNIIEYNHIHDIGQGILSDMGGIYLLGEAPGTIVRNNLFHDIQSHGYGGWGIYTDEGSTNVLIENNIVYRTKCGGFHQHYGKENTVRNNIFAFSTEGQIIKSRSEPHLTVIFERNIVYWTEGPLLGGDWSGDTFTEYNPFDWKRTTEKTYEFDYNIYFNPERKDIRFKDWTFEQWQQHGRDVHSVFADPLFVNPAEDDFTLRPESPAFKLGFRPIDISTVGPRN